MGADYTIELISIETYAPQFIVHNKNFLGSVHCYVPLCTTFKDPCCSAPVLGTKVVNVFDLKFSAQMWLFCHQKIVLLILHSSSCWDSCTQSIVYNSYQKFASQISIFHENKLIKFNLNVCKSVLCLNQWFMSRIDTELFLPYKPGPTPTFSRYP